MSPPLKRWGHVGLPLSAQFVRSVCVCAFSTSVCPIYISPVLGYCVVFSATLYVGQRHRRRANINPDLVKGIMPVPPACRYRLHEILTSDEWIMASTGDAGPTFNIHWVGVGL